jgi:hypothetical protein
VTTGLRGVEGGDGGKRGKETGEDYGGGGFKGTHLV